MMMSRPPDRPPLLALLMPLVAACSAPADSPDVGRDGATVRVSADAWADNWFALYLGDRLVHEDGVSIETERSFNAESFEFDAGYPMQLNVVLKDFRENDTGLEYIGQRNQQMGDGGFVAQFKDAETGRTIAVTDSGWTCLVVHRAPLDKACEGETDPVVGEAPCEYESLAAPLDGRTSTSTTRRGRRRPSSAPATWTRRAATTRSTGTPRPTHLDERPRN